MLQKCPKPEQFLILSVAVGLLTSTGGVWVSLIWCLTLGIVAELIARAGNHKVQKILHTQLCCFCLLQHGTFLDAGLRKPAFLQSAEAYYGADYAATLDKFTPSWIILVLIGIAMLGGLIGGLIGSKLLKKHFQKAGVV